MPNEAESRIKINKLLEDAGWRFFNDEDGPANICLEEGVKLTQKDIDAFGRAFMTPKGGIQPHKRFSVQANRSEVLFVDYIAEHLNIKGRAGIIVPEGIIFQGANAYKALRKNLVEEWGLYAVVSLPSGVFQPYSGVKTSILC